MINVVFILGRALYDTLMVQNVRVCVCVALSSSVAT